MRSTWILVVVVLVGGALAWLNLSSTDDADPNAVGVERPESGGSTPAARPQPALKKQTPSAPSPAAATSADEKLASGIIAKLGAARDAGDKTKVRLLQKQLREKAWGADAARRYAVAEGHHLAAAGDKATNRSERMRLHDEARRLLSRGLFLPEMFAGDNSDTASRADLKTRITALNKKVMRYAPGIPGVTARYRVDAGIRPVQIVARRNAVGEGNWLTVFAAGTGAGKQLPMGPNAIMFWNQGDLEPRSMRAGSEYVIPLEELTIQVHRRHFRLAIFIGDWFVKEFRVGVGQSDTPTPTGEFKVHSKEENPDWWYQGKRIPFGDQRNELGSRWIALYGEELPLSAGIGIHGTNKPPTVGTRCSNGCVRLLNRHVNELFWWVRTGYDNGPATRIFIY